MFFNKSGNCFLPWNVTLFYRSLLRSEFFPEVIVPPSARVREVGS
jgi:hypothetical protein